MDQLSSVKEALHVSTSPSTVVCRENERTRMLEFCQRCIELETSGSMYVCGCPGTGKSLMMEKVKEALVEWAKEVWVTVCCVCPNCISSSQIRSYKIKIAAKHRCSLHLARDNHPNHLFT